MTLKEIAAEYRKCGTELNTRIRELQVKMAETDDEAEKRSLEGRITLLRVMRRDCREYAAFCEHYGEKGYHLNELFKM